MQATESRAGLRVLLIEDAPATAAVLQLYLEEMGIPDPHWVESLAEAEALGPRIASGHFDLILSDLLLDDDDAGAFLQRIAAAADCPIVVCSGSTNLSCRADLSSHTVLPKPVTLQALEATLNKLRPTRVPLQ